MKKINTEKMNGYFGAYGGRCVDASLLTVLEEIESFFKECINSQDFWDEFNYILKNFVGRPTPLLFAENATKALGGANIYLKLECLANTGAHKINNAIGQALLAKKMGKTRVIAETGAGQHGLATACACARLGLDCEIYMGEVDIKRQRPNVFWMEMFGARVIPVTRGTKILTDAVDEAFDVWSGRTKDTHYLIGSALGPSPYPDMVREFQSVIGRETKQQFIEKNNVLPDILIACVGGGSNAIGFFNEFIDDENVKLIGVEAGGKGRNKGENAVRMAINSGTVGSLQGYKSIFLQDEYGQLAPTHSICAGLDYSGIGPQLAYLGETGRIHFTSASDEAVINAVKFLAKHEGIVPALESSHALAEAIRLAPTMDKGTNIVVNISGRGDKDIFITSRAIDEVKWFEFLEDEVERYKTEGLLLSNV